MSMKSTFDPGEIIEDIEVGNEEWWIGACRGTRGLFPANFVKLIDDEGREAGAVREAPCPLFQHATRNDGNRSGTGANAAGGGIKRNGNRKGSVYLGFEER